MAILAIDLDGTLHDNKHPIEGRKMGPPMPYAKEALERLKAEGHTIIVHSHWGNRVGAIADWMKYWGLPFDEITNIKPQADLYIDDKALRFVGWDDGFLGVIDYFLRNEE